MNFQSILIALIVFGVFAAIVGKRIWNKKHHKGGGCGCGCSSCPSSGLCHPDHDAKN